MTPPPNRAQILEGRVDAMLHVSSFILGNWLMGLDDTAAKGFCEALSNPFEQREGLDEPAAMRRAITLNALEAVADEALSLRAKSLAVKKSK